MDENTSRAATYLRFAGEEIDHALTLLPESPERRELDKIYDALDALRCRVLGPSSEKAS